MKQALPPLAALRKPREIEDPLNYYVDRPLAYLVVTLLYPTRLTPNQVTYVATAFGLAAAVVWLVGRSHTWMVAGALLLWLWGILDGADGMLARAKGMQSAYGRALDGVLDMIVAVATVAAAFWRLWFDGHAGVVMAVGGPAVLLTTLQIYLYNFYQESYVRMTTPGHEELQSEAEIEEWAARLRRENRSLWERIVVGFFLLGLTRAQNMVVAVTNPAARREGVFAVTEATARIYRTNNAGPMRLWSWLALGPHTYLMVVFGALDRFDVYLWMRVVPFSAVWLLAMLWQRRASTQTLRLLGAASGRPGG